MSFTGTKVYIMFESTNSEATQATPPLQVRQPLPDVAFLESLPYGGLVEG